MQVIKTELPGVLIFEPKVFGDARGYFLETWNEERYLTAGLNVKFKQDNMSFSRKGVLRGLHMQNPGLQGKLVQVISGEVFDVAVDIRLGSPTFGKWTSCILSGENKRQFYVPEGFAHGFIVTSDEALFSYKCTNVYAPQHEVCILWNDPEIGITWPKGIEPQLSAKDVQGIKLADVPLNKLPKM